MAEEGNSGDLRISLALEHSAFAECSKCFVRIPCLTDFSAADTLGL